MRIGWTLIMMADTNLLCKVSFKILVVLDSCSLARRLVTQIKLEL